MSTESSLNEVADTQLRADALDYHRSPVRGKIEVVATKPLSNQRDLSLAYSPGVAYPCGRSRATRRRSTTTPPAAIWSR